MQRLIPTEHDTPATFGQREARAIVQAAEVGLPSIDIAASNLARVRDPDQLHSWLRGYVLPFVDRAGGSTIPTPHEVLTSGLADCKGYAVLAIAAARAVGLVPTYLGMYGIGGDCFRHCAVYIQCPYDVTTQILVDPLADKVNELQANGGPVCAGAYLPI